LPDDIAGEVDGLQRGEFYAREPATGGLAIVPSPAALLEVGWTRARARVALWRRSSDLTVPGIASAASLLQYFA